MNAIEVSTTTTTTINHAELGADVWEWDADQQAAFLASFAATFKEAPGVGIMQIHYIAEELRKSPQKTNAVLWLAELLTEYLTEEGTK